MEVGLLHAGRLGVLCDAYVSPTTASNPCVPLFTHKNNCLSAPVLVVWLQTSPSLCAL
jgi:hypothetical protein